MHGVMLSAFFEHASFFPGYTLLDSLYTDEQYDSTKVFSKYFVNTNLSRKFRERLVLGNHL